MSVTPPLADLPEGVDADAWASACTAVRSYCGWHVAPVVTETVTLDVAGFGPLLFLPTLHLVSVAEVRDVTRDAPTVLDGWRTTAAGAVASPRGWPIGFSAVEVDMVHGFDECPADILAVLQSMTSVSSDLVTTQDQAGPFMVSSPAYATAGPASLSYTQMSILAPYRLPPRP